ncbi:hypothetical protein [Morganella morganii]|uniref:tail fiber/spike domain-containing protein n=1 Tax=Morganella morganii TaxID=582 RepID=UPI003EBE7D85
MSTIPTQNAVPSEAPRDLKFNSGKIDEFVTSLEHEYKDRFGRCHMTIEGMKWMFDQLVLRFKVDMNQAIISAGYITVDSFQQGAQLPDNEITLRNQILRDETTGEYYRWDGDLPKSVPVGSTPESAGGVGAGKWVGVGDASLRTEIVNSGDKLVGSSFGNTVYADYSRLTIARKASFADGGILNSDKEAALAGDGFFYVYKGAHPVTITPGSSPDSNWLCCGLLNGYPLHNFKNFKGENSDTDALTKCIDFNNFVHIDENTEIYIEPIVLTKSMTIRIDGVVYADRNCPDLCVLISATGVDDITIEGHGRIDGNEKEVTSSKMRLIHLTGGGNRHRVYGITLGNNYISEADYTGYAESTLWIDGGVEHEVRGVRLVDYGLEGISVCAERSVIADIISTSSWGKTGGTRCLNYSTLHTLGANFIVTNISSYNTGASAIGIDSTDSVVTDINVDTVRWSNGVGLGHPGKPASRTIVSNCVIKNVMQPPGSNRAGVGVSESTDVQLNNISVVNSTVQGVNISAFADRVSVTNLYAENCDTALSMFRANVSITGMSVKACKNGISKQNADDKLILSNVDLTGADTKILGSEDNISGVNVTFDSSFPRQGVAKISNETLPVKITNPNIRPWSTISITPTSANSASSLPYITAIQYGILQIGAVNSPVHYAGIKWYVS